MITNQHPHPQRLASSLWLKIAIGSTLIVLILPLLIYAGFLAAYKGKIYPGVTIGTLPVGGYPFGEAVAAVSLLTDDFQRAGYINLTNNGQLVQAVSFEDLKLRYDAREVVRAAYELGRGAAWYQRLPIILDHFRSPRSFDFSYSFDPQALELMIESVSETINQPGVSAHIYLDEAGKLAAHPGEDGIVVDETGLKQLLTVRLQTLSTSPIEIPMTITKNQVTESQVQETLARALLLSDSNLELSVEYPDKRVVNKTVEDSELWSWLSFDGSFQESAIRDYLESLSQEVNVQPQDALFQVEADRVTTFKPSVAGVSLEIQASLAPILNGLSQLERGETVAPIVLATMVSQPTIKTGDVNDLGIVAILGRGESTYKGSIAGRVHNVALTASKLHGVLIKPGETFSFNQTVGEISRRTGYQAAYVIQNGRTVLGDGGGVCQASTTLFRAILDAGLPIEQRKAHSYRVSYYEQGSKPGFDATVFSPSVDLTFTNDTAHHILIQASADSANTYMSVELYGTPDGRVSEISGYQQWDAVSAPAPLYQDDPTLPPGTVRQVDWAAPGLKVKFDYNVTRDGATLFEKTFYSTYRPWQAVYLRGV